jgi:predicted aspartyl protease
MPRPIRTAARLLAPALIGLVLAGEGAALARPAAPPHACALVRGKSGADLVSLPFRTIDGRIYVEAKANGRGPYIFALDTGASGMGRVDTAMVAALALPAAGGSETSDGVRATRVETVRLGSLALGGLERRDLELIARDYRSRVSPEAAFAGILGREFFADGLLVIDYPRRRVRFTRDRGLSPAMRGALPYQRAFRVPVTIGNVDATGNLDTGANVAFVLPRALYDRVSTEPLAAGGQASLTNSTIATGRARLKGPFTVGEASAADVEVKVSGEFPELLVGAHFLQHHALLIDQRSQTVALCPGGAKAR